MWRSSSALAKLNSSGNSSGPRIVRKSRSPQEKRILEAMQFSVCRRALLPQRGQHSPSAFDVGCISLRVLKPDAGRDAGSAFVVQSVVLQNGFDLHLNLGHAGKAFQLAAKFPGGPLDVIRQTLVHNQQGDAA